ncbi:MAG TPA: crotonase/enoyl-CoA hydratase family protein, partial [Microthrixaceae bacterium]|nr:crotonase/enoyl-CoA hydratase family protein [Microthrixaceae bacterium]
MDTTRIRYDVHDGVATITLARPDLLNAFDVPMMREMIAALDEVDADDAVRAVVVTGDGRAFCAGADLSAGGDSFDYETVAQRGKGAEQQEQLEALERIGRSGRDGELRDGGGILALRIFRCRKPVIAAVNGAAVGIGATMTLPMDIRLASERARFGFVFAARGIVPEACSSWFLPRVVGISTAAEWVYTARLVAADEALRAGLLRSVHPAGEVLGAAQELGREIARNSAPVSVAMSRMMLWRGLVADHPMEAHRVESRGVNYTGRRRDAVEGITAFFEKRPAVWSMSVNDDLPP